MVKSAILGTVLIWSTSLWSAVSLSQSLPLWHRSGGLSDARRRLRHNMPLLPFPRGHHFSRRSNIAMVSMGNPLSSNVAIGAVLTACSVGGILAERTKIGARITGALCSFCLSAILGNVGILPPAHTMYHFCWDWVLPASLAISIVGGGGGAINVPGQQRVRDVSLFHRTWRGGVALAFIFGALGTFLGSILAFSTSKLPRPLAAQCAAALCATYIGGSANLFVVAKLTGLSADVATLGALAASDVALMGVYFAALFSASASKTLRRHFGGDPPSRGFPISETKINQMPLSHGKRIGRWAQILVFASWISAVAALAAMAGLLVRASDVLGNGLPIGSSTALLTLLSSMISYILRRLQRILDSSVDSSALLFSAAVSKLRSTVAPVTANFMLLLFFCAVGASAKLSTFTGTAAGSAFLIFATITLFVHCSVMLVGVEAVNFFERKRLTSNEPKQNSESPIGRPAVVSLDEMLVASNANIGGPATAAGFAGLIGRVDLVPAAALWGTVGYAAATPLAIALYAKLLR